MIATAHWLRHVAQKYKIQGVDLAVVEGCAQQMDRWPADLNKLTGLARQLAEGLADLDTNVRGSNYRTMAMGDNPLVDRTRRLLAEAQAHLGVGDYTEAQRALQKAANQLDEVL